MKVSLRWLKQYIDINLSVEELVKGLTMSGLEVEEVLDLGLESKSFIIGQIERIDSHPNADKLSVCQVNIQERVLNIVCGASNMKSGDKVVVALPGSVLPNGLNLKKTKIRGVASEGMMCSSEELGLPKTQDGILILSPEETVGEGFDVLLDISITPNRPDCLSLIGIAREVQALTDNSVKIPKPRFSEKLEPSSSYIDITIQNKTGCPRYCARILENIRIQPSPLWLQNALVLAGMRPINNIVDVTNFVLLELGHPLHAFDYDLIKGKKILVRNAQKGEKLPAIDEREYTLDKEDLVIADKDRPIALAGIIGGKNTEVNQDSTSIVLEAAYFNPQNIRRSARRIGIHTEASYHFERGMDPEILPLAINRATELIQQITGAEVKKDIIDVCVNVYNERPSIHLYIPRVNQILGTDISLNEINTVFQKLDIEVIDSGDDYLIVRPPSYRVDIERDIDCIEEIARIYGYDSIPATYPYISHIDRAPVVSEHSFLQEFKDIMVGSGLREVLNYSFLSGQFQKEMGFDSSTFIPIANPISNELDTLRVSLIPGLLKTLLNNQALGHEAVNCFEAGKTFVKNPNYEETEEWQVSFIITGQKLLSWYDKKSWDFYDLKGIAESVLDKLDIKKYSVQRMDSSTLYHPGKSLYLKNGNTIFFEGGELHPLVAQNLGLQTAVYCGQFYPQSIKQNRTPDRDMFRLYRFPGNHRDISMIFDSSIPYADIESAIRNSGGPLLWKVLLVDHYQNPQLGENKKSLTFHLIYRDPEKTLSDNDVKPSFEAIIRALETQFQARLR